MPNILETQYEEDIYPPEKIEEPEEYEILIPRTRGILGVNVRKDFDESLTGLFVHSFVTTSKAYEQNLLRVNDEILGVNNNNVEGAELVDYISALSRYSNGENVLLHIRRYSGTILDFIDYKRKSTCISEEEESSEARIVGSVYLDGVYVAPDDVEPTPVQLSHGDEDFDEYELSVPKTNGSLQINIRHDTDVDSPLHGLFVHHIDPSSNAYRQGLLQINDQILGIDDFNVVDADLDGVVQALGENTSDHVVLLLRRYGYDVWHKINSVRNSVDVNEPSISTQEILSPRHASPRMSRLPSDDAANFRLLLDNMQLEVNTLKQKLNSVTATVTAYTMEVDEMKHVLNDSLLSPLRTSMMTTPRTMGKTEISPIERRHSSNNDTPIVAEKKESDEVIDDSKIDSKIELPIIRTSFQQSQHSQDSKKDEESKADRDSPVITTARSRESKQSSAEKKAEESLGNHSARSHHSTRSRHCHNSDVDEFTQTDFMDDKKPLVPSDDGGEGCSPRCGEECSVLSSNQGEGIMPLVFDDMSQSSHGSSICSRGSNKSHKSPAQPDSKAIEAVASTTETTLPEIRRISRPDLYVKTTSLSSSQLTNAQPTELSSKLSQLSKSMDATKLSPLDAKPQVL